eukprot:Opistho-1_new@94148
MEGYEPGLGARRPEAPHTPGTRTHDPRTHPPPGSGRRHPGRRPGGRPLPHDGPDPGVRPEGRPAGGRRRPERPHHVRRHARPEHGEPRRQERPRGVQPGQQGRALEGRPRLALLRRADRGRRPHLRRHQQRAAAEQARRGQERRRRPGAGRPRHPDVLRGEDRRVPLADGVRQAPVRAGERLAEGGAVLDPAGRGRPGVLHVQPLHRGVPRRQGVQGRQPGGPDREVQDRDGRRRAVGVRPDQGAERLPPPHVLCVDT